MIRRLCSFCIFVLAACALAGVAVAADESSSAPNKVLDGFLEVVKADSSLPAERVQKATEIVNALRGTPEGESVALTEALCELFPDYRTALAALAEENTPAAIETLKKLRETPNDYLQADADYFLARGYVLDELFEEAAPLIDDLLARKAAYSTHSGDALFLKGVAEVQLLKHKEATVSFEKFLSDYPAAPERMRVGAFRQLEQLKMFEEGALSDVHLRMEYSRRRLALEDSGEGTRAQQDKIVEMLAKLIKDAEEKEGQGSGSGSGKGQKPSQGEGQGESQAEGQGQGQGGTSGGGSKGIDSDTVNRLHRGGPRSPWSQLRNKERDPVFNAIKEKFPARYQQLIEQYYKSFDDETEG